MRQKLGLLELVDEEKDKQLVEELFEVWPPFDPFVHCTLGEWLCRECRSHAPFAALSPVAHCTPLLCDCGLAMWLLTPR